MKKLLVFICCLGALECFSQTSEVLVEEKSSGWIKVAAAAPTVRPKAATITKKKPASSKPVAPRQDAGQEFDKTNQQVNRFRKVKKD